MEQKSKQKHNEMIICLPYDLKFIYPFMCRNYGNIKYKEMLEMGYEEFNMKLSSIPETEPLYIIYKSRSININKIKDKEEKKYWRELKRINAIPDIYKTNEEIDFNLKTNLNELGGLKNVRKYN